MLAVEKSQIAGIDPVAGVLSVMALFSTDIFFLTPNRAYCWPGCFALQHDNGLKRWFSVRSQKVPIETVTGGRWHPLGGLR
jgi:hypothetical protein